MLLCANYGVSICVLPVDWRGRHRVNHSFFSKSFGVHFTISNNRHGVSIFGCACSMEDAKRLIDLVQDIPCKINLISFNPHSGSLFRPTSDEKMIEFRNTLAAAGCVVFMRLSRGDDQMAACGQLGIPDEIQVPLLRVPAQFRTVLEASF